MFPIKLFNGKYEHVDLSKVYLVSGVHQTTWISKSRRLDKDIPYEYMFTIKFDLISGHITRSYHYTTREQAEEVRQSVIDKMEGGLTWN